MFVFENVCLNLQVLFSWNSEALACIFSSILTSLLCISFCILCMEAGVGMFCIFLSPHFCLAMLD